MKCYDEFASEYDTWFLKNSNLLTSEVKLVARTLENGGDILSVGCGSGLAEAILRRDFGIVVADGVEPSSGMVEIARQRGLNVITAGAADFPIVRKYDTVLMNSCSPYFDDLDAAFRHVGEALKEGGRLVVAEVPKDSAYAMVYNLAMTLGTWDHPLLVDVRPPNPYPIEFVKSAKWRTTAEKVESLQRCGFTDLKSFQTLTMHPVDSNSFVEEPTEGSNRGSFVAIVARRIYDNREVEQWR